MKALFVIILTLTLVSLNVAIKEPNGFFQEKIANQYFYYPEYYDNCEFQNSCPYNGATFISFEEYSQNLNNTVPMTTYNFLQQALQPLGATFDQTRFNFRFTSQKNNMGRLTSESASQLQSFFYGQTTMFDTIGQFLNQILTSNYPDNEVIQQSRQFGTCPLGIFLTSYEEIEQDPYYMETEGNSGCGMGIGAQIIMYDSQEQGSQQFQVLASFGGGAGGGISQDNAILTSWGSGGGAGVQLNSNYGATQPTVIVSRGGGVGFGYDSQQCPAASADNGSNANIIGLAEVMSNYFENNNAAQLAQQGKSLLLVGGGGAGGGIGNSSSIDFSFGFQFYVGDASVYNQYLQSSTTSGETNGTSTSQVAEMQIQNQFISCTSQSQQYNWPQLTACVCKGITPDVAQSMTYLNCPQ